ncbi:DNA glycosylase AlkZ-like family protein [Pseudarthrobacter sp. P1]|uniref:DNA glycosylase AlkZ-like family protein n=1 Tax=Pseudarthrobacter sp. P1 TaxID=3418418 RepID=UPI003CF2EF37
MPSISPCALGRATLARQLLLERSTLAPLDAVEQLAGLQAQTPQSWYTGLWTRLLDFDAAAFGRLLEDRAVVRIALMRSTIHLVSARDALAFRPLVQPVIERSTRGSFARQWAGLDLDAVAAAGRGLMEAQPMTFAELGRALQERWPEHNRLALGQAARSAWRWHRSRPAGCVSAAARSATPPSRRGWGGPSMGR